MAELSRRQIAALSGVAVSTLRVWENDGLFTLADYSLADVVIAKALAVTPTSATDPHLAHTVATTLRAALTADGVTDKSWLVVNDTDVAVLDDHFAIMTRIAEVTTAFTLIPVGRWWADTGETSTVQPVEFRMRRPQRRGTPDPALPATVTSLPERVPQPWDDPDLFTTTSPTVAPAATLVAPDTHRTPAAAPAAAMVTHDTHPVLPGPPPRPTAMTRPTPAVLSDIPPWDR